MRTKPDPTRLRKILDMAVILHEELGIFKPITWNDMLKIRSKVGKIITRVGLGIGLSAPQVKELMDTPTLKMVEYLKWDE